MFTSRALLRDCFQAAPAVVAGAWVFGGAALAGSTAIAAAAVVLWLALSERAVRRVVATSARSTSKAARHGAAFGFVLTHLAALPGSVGLLFALGAAPVALGLLVLVVGTSVRATVTLLHAGVVPVAPPALLTETSC